MDPQLDHHHKIQWLLDRLTVPPEFARYDAIEEADTIAQLDEWKIRACDVLHELKKQLEEDGGMKLCVEEQGQVIAKVVAFENEEPWAPEPATKLSSDILAHFPDPSIPLLEHILATHVKPLFQSTPHPLLNASTGRTLPRPAGGPGARQDHYEGQEWKHHPGAAALVAWCVRHIPRDAYERVWPLVVPPLMTLLDDYEAPHKLRGLRVLAAFLARVPPALLRRTGLDALLFSSMKTTLTHLHNPATPALVRAAVPLALNLTELTTTPGSAARFNQLCSLLGESIVGGIWLYAPNDRETVEASLEVLPDVVRALRLGSVRYLKAMVPQLTHPLLADSFELAPFSTKHRVLALRALQTVVRVCAPRMHRWKEAILEGVAKCWVVLWESDSVPEDDAVELKKSLQQTAKELAAACPSVLTDEYPQFLAADAPIFSGLFG